MTKNKELTAGQQRVLCDICCRYEDCWAQGNRVSPEDFLSQSCDIDSAIVLEELHAIQEELESRIFARSRKELQFRDQRYTFIEEIARGGTAVVWRVRDRHLQRETAVKYLLDCNNNQQMRFRLEQEARLCARLTHPGIIPIYELSSFADDRPFVSMKLVEGKSLQQLLEQDQPIPTQTAIEIFYKVCQTLAFAHELGIVHRDLKPANIMVGSFAEVYVMDWGLGKDLNILDSDDLEAPQSHNPNSNFGRESAPDSEVITKSADAINTLVGTVFGTLPYLSPEQAQGRVDVVDTRSDVFALGAILCRILTGAAPYDGNGKEELLRQAQNGDLQAARQRLQNCSYRRLAELAITCMSIDPNKRPLNAQAVVDELDNQQQAATSRRRIKKASWVVASVLLFLVLAAAVIKIREPGRPIAASPAATVASSSAADESITDVNALKSLFRAGQNEVALKAYRRALELNPNDTELHHAICNGLLASGRFDEAHEVARRLVDLSPVVPEFTCLLGQTLVARGKLKEAYDTISDFKQSTAEHSVSPMIEEDLAWISSAIELSQASAEAVIENTVTLSNGDLLQQARMLDATGRIELAIRLYRLSIERELIPGHQSVQRHRMLIEIVRKHLNGVATSRDIRNLLCKTSAELTREQIRFADETMKSPQSSPELRTQAIQVLELYDHKNKVYDFLHSAVTDSRIAPDVRAELEQAIRKTKTMLNRLRITPAIPF